jgi:hypothetical protein
MKQASRALSTVAAVMGKVATDQARNVDIALSQRVREEKAGTSTPCRNPLGMLTNVQTGLSSNKAPVKKKAKVLNTSTASNEARDLRP